MNNYYHCRHGANSLKPHGAAALSSAQTPKQPKSYTRRVALRSDALAAPSYAYNMQSWAVVGNGLERRSDTKGWIDGVDGMLPCSSTTRRVTFRSRQALEEGGVKTFVSTMDLPSPPYIETNQS